MGFFAIQFNYLKKKKEKSYYSEREICIFLFK